MRNFRLALEGRNPNATPFDYRLRGARTMALDAQKLGQRLTWDAAVERGDIDGNRLMKRWGGVLDDRERPEHVAMEGEVVGYDDAFSNGEQVPGESTFRCIAFYATAQDPAVSHSRAASRSSDITTPRERASVRTWRESLQDTRGLSISDRDPSDVVYRVFRGSRTRQNDGARSQPWLRSRRGVATNACVL